MCLCILAGLTTCAAPSAIKKERDTADKDATRLVSCTLDISRLVIDAALCMRGLMCLLTRSLSKAAYKMSP